MKKILGLLLGFLFLASFSFAGGMSSVTNPAGSDTGVQFNNGGVFGSDSDYTFTGGNTVNVDYVNVPRTIGSEGSFNIGGNRFLHMFGSNSNVFVGESAGNFTATSASGQTCIGNDCLKGLTGVSVNNSCVGDSCLMSVTSGDNNTCMGRYCLLTVTTGGGNIAIGLDIGAALGNISNKFMVDNFDDTTPFLYGELDNERLGIETNAPTARFHLPAGIATAGYGPFKLTSGTDLTTPEAGTYEYDGTTFKVTPSTVRKSVVTSSTSTGGAAPTVTGFGTSSSVTYNNGTYVFTINVGTGGTASTGTINMPPATVGWYCGVNNVTNSALYMTKASGVSNTVVAVTNYSMTTGLAVAWTASDALAVSCSAF